MMDKYFPTLRTEANNNCIYYIYFAQQVGTRETCPVSFTLLLFGVEVALCDNVAGFLRGFSRTFTEITTVKKVSCL